MAATTVRDIMLSLSEYAVVREDATLSEALEALEQAQLLSERHPHRAVLVRSAQGEIVGKLDHLAFLRALLLEQRPWSDQAALDIAGVSEDMKRTSESMLELFDEDVTDLCDRARNIRVSDVCTRATASIAENASLTRAIRAFIQHRTLSLLVTRHEATVGVLRLADLFDELAGHFRKDPGHEPNG